jgi:hypothetical protein
VLGGGSNTHPRQGATWPCAGNKYANFGLAAVDAHPGTDDEAGQISTQPCANFNPEKKNDTKQKDGNLLPRVGAQHIDQLLSQQPGSGM